MGSSFAAVVLAGGTAARLDGADKASVEVAGRTLLEHALEATAAATETVVVGEQVPTSRPVTFTREEPAYGGPAAGLLAGRDALAGHPDLLLVLAVDMPGVTAATVDRLVTTAAAHDGAFLADPSGRRQLAGVLDLATLDRTRPDDTHGLPLHRLLEGLDLALLAGAEDEARDVDTWADVEAVRSGGCGAGPTFGNVGP
jgi:molybdopterin-guanine dinucleotide biosynthesis protein A